MYLNVPWQSMFDFWTVFLHTAKLMKFEVPIKTCDLALEAADQLHVPRNEELALERANGWSPHRFGLSGERGWRGIRMNQMIEVESGDRNTVYNM